MWKRKPGFTTLVHIILEQQVSLASAKAAFDRLIARVSPLTPVHFLKQNDAKLKAIGFSRQKTVYCRHLAQTVSTGQLNLAGLNLIDDNAVRQKLITIKGIGLWTANIYLLMALRRPDIWPVRDLALSVATQRLKNLPSRPTPDELDSIGSNWKPWRAVATRILWHYYLQNIKRKSTNELKKTSKRKGSKYTLDSIKATNSKKTT